jgi:hypothetical protein
MVVMSTVPAKRVVRFQARDAYMTMARAFRAALMVLSLVAAARELRAQQVERPVPFDSAGRVLVLTPMLVERLQLTPPVWPVAPGFTEARLYATGDSTRVLVVRRGDAVERYTFSAVEADALRRAITDAATRSGMPVQSDGTASVDNPAGSRFVTSQTVRGLFLYAPLAAGIGGGATTWALVSAGTFFIAQAIASDGTVTAPMASLSGDLAFRSASFTALALGESLFDAGGSTASTVLLGASLAGATVGFLAGRKVTLAEAEALGWGSTTTALLGLGLAASAQTNGDVARAVTAAGLVAGLPLGLAYARNASYSLTAGDLYAMRVPQVLGAAWGAVAGEMADASDQTRALLATAGFAAGAVLGDRFLAKPYDLSVSNAGLLATGAGISALAGLYLVSNNGSPSDLSAVLAPTLAATLGTLLSAGFMDLRPARRIAHASPAMHTDTRRRPVVPSHRGARLRFEPSAVLSAATRTPGHHTILSVTF